MYALLNCTVISLTVGHFRSRVVIQRVEPNPKGQQALHIMYAMDGLNDRTSRIVIVPVHEITKPCSISNSGVRVFS